MPQELIALVTCPKVIAEKMAVSLVEAQVAACVNIIAEVTSVYQWEDNIEKEPESLLIVKTNDSCWKAFEKKVNELHPYDVPEIISVSIEKGNKAYLDWLNQSVAKAKT